MAIYTGTTGDDVLVSTNTSSTTTTDTLLGLAGSDLLIGGFGNDTLDGGVGIGGDADAMYGGNGNDIYLVYHTGDTVNENPGEGTDTVRASVTFSLAAFDNVENITAVLGAGAIDLTGNDGNNTLDGSINTSVNTLTGALGNDSYIVGTGDVIVENASEGTDTVRSTSAINLTLAAFTNVENATMTGTTAGNLTGTTDVNILTGNTAINTLDGGAGADTMIGGGGADVYLVDDAGDVVTGGTGIDTVLVTLAAGTYSIASSPLIERVTLQGITDIHATGNALVNVLTGNAGNNTLNGGAGADTLVGLAGDDTYVVDLSTDKITEVSGTDTVIFNGTTTGTTYTLALGLENLTLGGTANINGTGNTAVNIITGNTGNNTLSGGTGADTMIGGGGNDTYIVENIGDVVTGGAGIDTINVTLASGTYSIASSLAIERVTLGGTAAVNVTGNVNANVLTGNSAANVLDDGGVGAADSMIGGAGNDTYVVYNAADSITETSTGGTDTVHFYGSDGQTYALGSFIENLTLMGVTNSNATGGGTNNVLIGNSGNNTLDGGLGNDVMKGGAGNDTYLANVTADVVSELSGQGTDSVIFSGAGTSSANTLYTLSAYIENLTLGGTASINGNGNAQDNVITGNSGNNIMNGSGGTDTVSYANATGDVVVDLSVTTAQVTGFGSDTLSNFENLTGSANNDTLTGTSGNNVIEGGDGNDLMTGNGGTDTASYSTASSGVTVNLSNGAAQNTVGAGTDTLSGFLNVTGSAFDDVLTGTSGNNVMNGGNGTDTVSYANASSWVWVDLSDGSAQNTFGAGTDTLTNFENLTGSAFDDLLFGDGNNNTLDGGGADTSGDYMAGGGGDDTFIVRDANDFADGNLAGADTLVSYVDNDLDSHSSVEDLTLMGSAVVGDGDAGSNVITGNSTLASTLTGDGGNDTLIGGAAVDTLTGGSGNDVLDGGAGGDLMDGGGSGNDTFYVDDAGDAVTAGSGTDTVISSVDYTLGANMDNLTLAAGALVGTGNGSANTITGNNSGNTMDGAGGADSLVGGTGADSLDGGTGGDDMAGGDGNDVYFVDDAGDTITENASEGTDTVNVDTVASYTLGANVDNLVLTMAGGTTTGTGNGDANVITGNNSGNVLSGAGGDDTVTGGTGTDDIDGGDGNDFLTGGLGVDTFSFTTAPNATTNVDTISDFDPTAVTGDVLDVSAILSGGPLDATGYVDFVTSGADTNVFVDADGGADGWVLAAVLQGVTGLDGTEDALVTAGTLVI